MSSVIPGAYYQVFLSFRGADTRTGFTDCLYHFLTDAGVTVFRDNEEIRPGMQIEVIKMAIKNSILCIPIFSKRYADSKWCLIELAQMVKLKKKIMPVFYDVTPDDVKLKTSTYRTHLDDHVQKKKVEEAEIKEWERALEDVLQMSGWESNDDSENLKQTVKIKGWQLSNFEGYGELCKLIVREVLENLKVKDKILTSHLVGIEDQVQKARKCFDFSAARPRYVGIYGMGGFGKTTLAKIIYNEFHASFDTCSFLSNVRESSKTHGLKYLVGRLLNDLRCKLLEDKISNSDDAIKILRGIYQNHKVLIVLDDVDEREQIEELAGSLSWFKAGSRVLITTRDIRVLGIEHEKLERSSDLKKSDGLWAMEVRGLKEDQALKLFSQHAFGASFPPAEYLDLSKKVVSIAGQLPLALEIIGSHLRGHSIEEWDSKIKSLARMPHGNIQKQLLVSYEALDPRTKQMFLDIACYPTSMKKSNAMYMWRSCDFNPDDGIKALTSMSLVKIEEDDTLVMHDYLRDLGREIVRMENLVDYAEHSRLWIHEEALDVLKKNEGTKKIQVLHLSDDDHLQDFMLTQVAFNKLRNLRMLGLYGLKFSGNMEHKLSKLRWLSWHRCPDYFAAVNVHLGKLVVLDLSRSDISERWSGWSNIVIGDSLEVMDLSFCESLTSTPDLSRYKNLKRLMLEGCSQLKRIDKSIGELKRLQYLNVKLCGLLTFLPEEIGWLESLQVLDIAKTIIRTLPKSIGKLKKLEELRASYGCLGEISDEIGGLSNLRILDLSYTYTNHLPRTINQLSLLQTLNLEQCDCLPEIPELPSSLSSLVFSSKCMMRVPNISNLSNLSSLKLRKQNGEESAHHYFSRYSPYRMKYPSVDWRAAKFPRLEEFEFIVEEITALRLEVDAVPHLKSLRLSYLEDFNWLCLPQSLTKLELYNWGDTNNVPESLKNRAVSIKECET